MESELVSGFMTEHAAVIFVFFFLAEYGSIVLICTLLATLFIGGYLLDITFITYLIKSCFCYLIDFLDLVLTTLEANFYFILDLYHEFFSIKINTNLNALDTYYLSHQHSAGDKLSTFIFNTALSSPISNTGLSSHIFDYLLQGILYGFILGLKAFFMIFLFI